MEIRKPKKADDEDPCVTVFKTGLKGLDCEFVVSTGTYQGLKIWENLFLPPDMQTISLSKGQEGKCKGDFAKLRGIIDAVRGLDPNGDGNRSINSWWELNGLEFPVRAGIQKPKKGFANP